MTIDRHNGVESSFLASFCRTQGLIRSQRPLNMARRTSLWGLVEPTSRS